SFLASIDDQGHTVDFHSLRKTFVTNLTRSGAAPKTAQILARHSDINLTMNTYTMLGVMDQAAAVEALPPIPTCTDTTEVVSFQATGTGGPIPEVPPVVPSGAENGAVLPASNTLRIASNCTESDETGAARHAITLGKSATSCTDPHQPASECERRE